MAQRVCIYKLFPQLRICISYRLNICYRLMLVPKERIIELSILANVKVKLRTKPDPESCHGELARLKESHLCDTGNTGLKLPTYDQR